MFEKTENRSIFTKNDTYQYILDRIESSTDETMKNDIKNAIDIANFRQMKDILDLMDEFYPDL